MLIETKYEYDIMNRLITEVTVKENSQEKVGATEVSQTSLTTRVLDSDYYRFGDQPSPDTHEVNEQLGQGGRLTQEVTSMHVNDIKVRLPAPEPPKLPQTGAD